MENTAETTQTAILHTPDGKLYSMVLAGTLDKKDALELAHLMHESTNVRVDTADGGYVLLWGETLKRSYITIHPKKS